MHQKNIILFLKVSYMFRPCWAIFREKFLTHYACVHIVKCECALGFILRLRGVAYYSP
jgi:hypothetical protein